MLLPFDGSVEHTTVRVCTPFPQLCEHTVHLPDNHSPWQGACASVKDESLGLVSVSRLRAPRLSVSSRSRSNFRGWSRLGLVSWGKFCRVSSRSRLGGKNFIQSRLGLVSGVKIYSVSSRSRLGGKNFIQSRLGVLLSHKSRLVLLVYFGSKELLCQL